MFFFLHALVLSGREAYVGFAWFGIGQSMRLQGALHALVLSGREAYVGFACFGRGQSMRLLQGALHAFT